MPEPINTSRTPAARQQAAPALQFGDNVTGRLGDDGILALFINTRAQGRPSASGKTNVIATTSGFKGVGNVSFSINVTTPKTA